MKRALCVAFTVIAVVTSLPAVRADVTTVVLTQDARKDFAVNAQDKSTETATLTFDIGPAPTPGAKVMECALRVVPLPGGSLARADQDVSVLSGKEQVGGWSAYGNAPEPYFARLQEKACSPGKSAVLTLTTDSPYAAWTYHGAGATRSADRPRLIVTYDSPNLARSAQTTAWAYKEPASFFSSEWYKLPSGVLLANPVFHDRAVYLVGGASDASRLYRVGGGAPNLVNAPLGLAVSIKSFAFVTAQGRLQLISTDAIRSCDLTTLQDNQTASCNEAKDIGAGTLQVDEKETPAMGADGSLYFKNRKAGASIVAFNPALREIWATELKLTAVSPIALSANGRYAYVLATITASEDRRNVLRVDTATGDVVSHEVGHCPSGSPCAYPALLTLLRPVVVTKTSGGDSIDYIFAAGNTSDKGYLQLLAFEAQTGQPRVVWGQQLGQPLSAVPALGVDENSLYVTSGGILIRYTWYDSKGLLGNSASPPPTESENVGANVSALLLDQAGSLYLHTDKGLYIYSSSKKKLSAPQPLGFSPTAVQFTPGGALIGYTGNAVYDLSPKAQSPLTVSAFDQDAIYSADNVTVADGAVAKAGERITVKAKSVNFKPGFRWPASATLDVQSVR